MARSACFIQVKAFGDLVIANAAANRVIEGERARLTLAIGWHLRPLCNAITPTIAMVELATTETGVPSIFDVRKNGAAAALRSAWQVRGAIAHGPIARDALVLLDRLGARERFLLGGRPAMGMPAGSANIYQGYDVLLADAGFALMPSPTGEIRGRRRAGIFPGSRIAAKNLPVQLVAALLDEAERRGVPTTLFLLDGERPDLEVSGLPHVIVPREFTALRDAIAGVDAVISADSLPAHLAETLRIDIFVLTPRPNEFWMPLSVFKHRRWCLFDDPKLLDRVGGLLAP